MRVISKFHDYYDRALGHGQDKSVMFIRNTDERKDAPAIMEPPQGIERNARGWFAQGIPFAIGFCGKVHRGIDVTIRSAGENPVRQCCYDIETLAGFLSTKKIDIGEASRSRWFHKTDWRAFMQKPQGDASAEAWFIEQKIPILVWDRALVQRTASGVVVNPMLKPYEFYRLFDAYQAYQELSMFVGGVLPSASADMATVSDDDRIVQRGFDKWSFRKMPS